MKQASQNHFDILIFTLHLFCRRHSQNPKTKKNQGWEEEGGRKNSKREDPLLLVDSLL